MDNLKHERSNLKAQLTRFKTFLTKTRKSIKDDNFIPTSELINEIKDRLDTISSILVKFENVQSQIAFDCLDSEAEDEIFEQFENTYFEQINIAKGIIKKFMQGSTENVSIAGSRASPIQSRSSSANSNHSSTNATSSANAKHYINLPKINLIKFNGNIDSWLEFKAIFQSLIHENDKLDEVQKLHYLKASLTGEANSVIGSLEFTATNYEVAWKSLAARFDQPKLIIKNHLNYIIELEAQKKESSQSLRKINDSLSKHISAAKSMATNEQLFEALIVYLVSNKLHFDTVKEWQMTFNKNLSILPSLNEFKEFLASHANFLETIEKIQPTVANNKITQKAKSFVVGITSCSMCNENHYLNQCEKFLAFNVQERADKVQELKLCFNCLSKGHLKYQCKSKYACKTCKSRHHTLLHAPMQGVKVSTPVVNVATVTAEAEPIQTISAFCVNASHVLLPTASAKVLDASGIYQTVRILLDSGSQSNFIRTDVCKRLKLPTREANISITGVSNANTHVNSKCELELSAHNNDYKIKLSCLVINEITGSVPSFNLSRDSFEIPCNIRLSDSQFNKPGKIDLLIGSPTFFELLCNKRIKLGHNLPILQDTQLGWIIAGPTGSNAGRQVQCHFNTATDLQDQITKFWEIDSYSTEKVLSPEENICESHFIENTTRSSEGRFIVSIPFKESPSILGNSYLIAQRRFLSLERRLIANPKLQESYCAFMREYKDLGHMSLSDPTAAPVYYLPHHGVHKSDSLTTKLRVVFDGSSKTTTGQSLNSIQMVGPVVQQDLFTILIRFRQHRYAISADVEKMYRQVQIEPSQRPLQRILWRFSPTSPIEEYDLNTVTYGTASASYLAIRSLIQTGIECETSLPEISQIIKNDFYVDDLLSGSDSIERARDICSKISHVLKQGCFNLRKWISNHPDVLSQIPKVDIHPGIHEFGDHEHSRTLGLLWFYQTDHFMFKISECANEKTTKRKMLSEIAQIFDPLGLLTPCTFIAKIFLQQLWLERIDWDDPVPPDLEKKWNLYRADLIHLNDLKIPRHVMCSNPIEIQVHGFCDASMNGYGACIYFRVIDSNHRVHINLLCAKSKVAPLKPTTIPKLELCGALLLSKLLKTVLKAVNLQNFSCYLWSDSTIVLGWLKTSPNLLKTFVCNRVADIQNLTENAIWRHVPTKANPADLLSRGASPQIISNSTLWWNGPCWLQKEESFWPNPSFCLAKLPDLKGETKVLVVTKQEPFQFKDYSNLNRLERVIAFCLRFKNNCSVSKNNKIYGFLTPKELTYSLHKLIKISQSDSFNDELKLLSVGMPLKKSSSLIGLNPFIDCEGLIRVGGRLHNTKYSYDKKHPLLIDGKHHLSKLIVTREHLKMFHAGPQLLLASVRDKFWITAGRNLVKSVVHRCVKCFRFSSSITRPIMGNLPAARAEKSFPFQHVGVDYAGPINIKDRRGRGSKTTKAYLCIYICFATKAVHLELVTSLSTEHFIMSFRRFVARRGKPIHVYSDNGTNFVGANNELLQLGNFLKLQESSIPEIIACEGTHWHFIPARSPHFGGLWEAGVKSCKFHLKRVIGEHVLVYEELCTLLYQVESILNSRPLAPLTSDPSDLQPLTPGHFLIGRSMTTVPDPDVSLIAENRLDAFQRIQGFQQHLWARWSKEYVSELQQRTKWKLHHSQLSAGSLVLIKEDSPPLKWLMGRVISLHPGSDGVNRVATLQTANGIIKRAFSKICPLPSAEN